MEGRMKQHPPPGIPDYAEPGTLITYWVEERINGLGQTRFHVEWNSIHAFTGGPRLIHKKRKNAERVAARLNRSELRRHWEDAPNGSD